MYSYINSKAMSSPQDRSYFNFLTEGITGKQWGYGIRRVKLTADPNAPEFVRKVPYTFTSSGFKDQEGNWFACLRMNVDQHSRKKMRPMNQDSLIHQLWGEMMLEFAQEYADKHKNNQISH
jgi:hypothetical protein